MIRLLTRAALACALALAVAAPARAQTFPTDNPVLRHIWSLGEDSSQAESLLQTLSDSIGPRLTGTPPQASGEAWLLARYAQWGIPARKEQYGTWKGWRRGATHIDLIAPRVRTLDGTMMAWSPGTKGNVDGDVMLLPQGSTAEEFAKLLPSVKGKFVMISQPEPTCRPDSSWIHWGGPAMYDSLVARRSADSTSWAARLTNTGASAKELPVKLEQAGALGVLSARWSRGWGVDKIFNARTLAVPQLLLGCEDYSLVARLVSHGQHPRIRVNAQADMLGDVPVFNVVAEMKGSEKPNEYVMLSAHFDSWDGSSGSTDNGTGTAVMMEAMRILKRAYPNPKRTILIGDWSGEEEGLVGSKAFAADHPEIISGLQALFNQDNGTGRIAHISMQGFTGAGAFFAKWMAVLPSELTKGVEMDNPGFPSGGGSDNASFVCYGAPSFGLGSDPWDYGIYTWHTNRDTYDKVAFDNVRANAVLVASLAYLASEDSARVGRERRVVMPAGREWPACTPPPRKFDDWTR